MANRNLRGEEPTLLSLLPSKDSRGSWTRVFDSKPISKEFDVGEIRQVSMSHSASAYTIRGMHYLLPSANEWKFIHCVRGAVFDQLVEVKQNLVKNVRVKSFDLSETSPSLLVVPPGWAHGFQTLTPDATLLYFMTADYDPDLERGFRYDDPRIRLKWPHTPSVVSKKDLSWPGALTENA